MSALQLRNLLEAGDVDGFRRFAAQAMPHLPQHKHRREWEIVMHHARTQCEAIDFAKRAWSHRWLTERNVPSGLPDALRPKAERMYPRVMTSVGISVNSKHPEVVRCVRGAMEDAVKACYADGTTDPAIVSRQMQIARAGETKRLYGNVR